MKRVAIFYKTYRKYGGQERVVYDFSHFLAGKGYKVDVWVQKVKDFPENSNITLHKVFIPNLGRGFRNLAFAIYSYLKGRKLRENGTVIFGFGKTFYQDIFRAGGGVHKFYVERALLRYRNKFLQRIQRVKRMLSFSHWVNIFIEKLTFENDNLKWIIVPTSFVKDQILEFFKVDEDKIVVVRNGVDLVRFNLEKKVLMKKELRRKFNLSEDEFVFSFVSTNHRLKGLEYLLEAIKRLKKREFRFKLLVVGGGDDKFFQKRISKLKIKDVVIYKGKLENVEEVYFVSDVFVYPTLFDASANVVLEAMASGTPVIASTYSGTHELIDEFENGLVIKDPTNICEIFEKMRFVIENREVVASWGLKAAEKIKNYPRERIFDEYEKLISKV